MTRGNFLPFELWDRVLWALPVASLLNVYAVSSEWRLLLNSRAFWCAATWRCARNDPQLVLRVATAQCRHRDCLVLLSKDSPATVEWWFGEKAPLFAPILDSFSGSLDFPRAASAYAVFKLAARCASFHSNAGCLLALARFVADSAAKQKATKRPLYKAVGGELASCLLAMKARSDCLRRALDEGFPWVKRLCVHAAKLGDVDCLRHLREDRGVHWSHRRVCKAAAMSGSLACLRYVHDSAPHGFLSPKCAKSTGRAKPAGQSEDAGGVLFARSAASAAELSGTADSQLGRGKWKSRVCEKAARAGNVECLRYVVDNGYPLGKSTFNSAARSGNIECLRYVCEKGALPRDRTCARGKVLCAIENCSAEDCVLHRHESCWKCVHACAEAAKSGNVECLRYARQMGASWTASVCVHAVRSGSLACLRYAHENGCPWHPHTCSVAVEEGNIEALYYAHQHGCPWDAHVNVAAVRSGDISILRYVHENNSDGPHGHRSWSCHVCEEMVKLGNLEMLRYACENTSKELHAATRSASSAEQARETREACGKGFPGSFLNRLCEVAARNGQLQCLRYVCETHVIRSPSSRVWKKAAKSGHLDCLRYAHTRGFPPCPSVCEAAAKNGHLDCLAYAHENGCSWCRATTHNALFNEHLECLQYASARGCEWGDYVYHEAVRRGAGSPKYLRLACEGVLLVEPWSCAANGADRELVGAGRGSADLERAPGGSCDGHNTWATSCVGGRLQGEGAAVHLVSPTEERLLASVAGPDRGKARGDSAQSLRREERAARRVCSGAVPWSAKVCAFAARLGYVDCLRYVHEEAPEELCGDRPWDGSTCEGAAGAGKLDCLRYAHENGCPWDKSTCEGAAEAGKLDCLRYAHENGCPWGSAVCVVAAANGRVECLAYALSEGCPCSEAAFVEAMKHGETDSLRLLFESRARLHASSDLYRTAMVCGAPHYFRFLHECGVAWDEKTCETAALVGDEESLHYARKNGCPWDAEKTMVTAVLSNSVSCLRYVCEKERSWSRAIMCNIAARCGSFDCLHYLYKSAPESAKCRRGAHSRQTIRSRDYCWDETTCALAAANPFGTACLRYAHESGCPWDETTRYTAEKTHRAFGNNKCLEYASSKGCPG